MGSFSFGAARTGGVVSIFFNSWKAWSAWSFHSKWVDFFMSRYRGRAFSPSRLIKRFREARHPVNF